MYFEIFVLFLVLFSYYLKSLWRHYETDEKKFQIFYQKLFYLNDQDELRYILSALLLGYI